MHQPIPIAGRLERGSRGKVPQLDDRDEVRAVETHGPNGGGLVIGDIEDHVEPVEPEAHEEATLQARHLRQRQAT